MADNYDGERVHRIGYIAVVPENHSLKQSNNYNSQSKQVGQSSFAQTTEKTNYVDKQTNSYARVTNRETFSTGDTFKERSTGRVGYKDEYKTTSTYKVGDKSGYTEYQVEERFRNVSYGGSNKGKGNGSSKNIGYY